MKRLMLYTLTCLLALVLPAYAYVGDAYVTPDTWSRHVNANGIKASINGLDFGDSGILKVGLTTRATMKFGEDEDWSIYQYARLRLSDAKLGQGTVNLNLNMRGAYDSLPSIGGSTMDGISASMQGSSYNEFYDGLYVSRKYDEYTRLSGKYDGNFRIYQANVEFKKVVPYTDISAGRIYLNNLDMYKIDGGSIRVDASDYFKIDVYGGLPVSYYSNMKTSVVGGIIEIPIEISGTKIRAEYDYFMHEDGGDYNTHAAKGRIDQNLNFPDILSSNIYLEGAIIGKAMLYEAGLDANIDKSRTGISAYITGQYDKNTGDINPYLSMYEDMLGGISEYVMGGVMLTQGITDYVIIGVGWETKFNFSEAYGDRDYQRVFGNVDLVGLIHKNNYLSLIVDWYDVPEYRRQDSNSKVMGGFRMTQVFTDRLEAWLGVNVQNFQYRSSPIKSYTQFGEEALLLTERDENTTMAYIGAMYRPVDWCVLQLDYTYEYADLFKSADLQPDIHTISIWANFIW